MFDVAVAALENGQKLTLPLSKILHHDAATLCIMGPYQDVALFDDHQQYALLRKMGEGWVGETRIRIATFTADVDLLVLYETNYFTERPNSEALAQNRSYCRILDEVIVEIEQQVRRKTIAFLN